MAQNKALKITLVGILLFWMGYFLVDHIQNRLKVESNNFETMRKY